MEYTFSEEVESRINYNKKLVKDIEEALENKQLEKLDVKVSRIIFKLAIGHSVNELSEGYCIKEGVSTTLLETVCLLKKLRKSLFHLILAESHFWR
ncbi:hypothetical protein B1748_08360 [Paenibacillus sp. MY03]|nr:hypothetical protein B1748_08360 [Paenibacillus sp. MY03]